VAARLLYGGRNSLLIGTSAALITCFIALLVGGVAGFFGGIVDGILSRLLDVVWAFPVYLLAISLSTVLIARGLSLGPIHLTSGSLLLPIAIIGLVYIPYVARPIRGEVLSIRRREFVEAAIGLGASNWRLLWGEVLPNVITTAIVLFPLMLAIDMLTEAALSFLSIGVQAPNASWGTIILDGQDLLYTRPAVALAPGVAIALTVLALNVLGDGIRDALDPRAKLRRTDQ
jgi:peptide/nickel transport system permease protein